MNPREEPERPSYSPLNLKKKSLTLGSTPLCGLFSSAMICDFPGTRLKLCYTTSESSVNKCFVSRLHPNAMHVPEYLYKIITGQSRRSFSRLESIFYQCCFIIEYYPLLAHNIGWKTEFLGTKFWWLKLYSIWWFTRVPENGLNTISLWEK